MKQHVTAVAILHLGLSIVGMIAAIAVVIFMILPGFLVVGIEGDAFPLTVLTTIACGIGTFVVVLSIPGIIGGIGLLKLQNWARYLVMILGALQLVNIPVGTAIGAYTLWALLQDETNHLFETGEEMPKVVTPAAPVVPAEPEGE